MLFGTGCSTRCVGEGMRGGRVARPEAVLWGAAVSRWEPSEVVAPHAAVAIRTTVAAETVLIISAPVAWPCSIGSTQAEARLSGVRL
jgi:hypothetical protein